MTVLNKLLYISILGVWYRIQNKTGKISFEDHWPRSRNIKIETSFFFVWQQEKFWILQIYKIEMKSVIILSTRCECFFAYQNSRHLAFFPMSKYFLYPRQFLFNNSLGQINTFICPELFLLTLKLNFANITAQIFQYKSLILCFYSFNIYQL